MNHPQVELCLGIHRAYASLRLQLDEELGTYHGIDFDDFALLHALAGAGAEPASLERLAAALGTSRSALLRRVRPLEKTGLVSCDGSVAGRRITLRAPGHALVGIAGDTVVRVCARPLLVEGIRSASAAR